MRATNLLPQGIVVPGCCQPLPWLRFWVRIGRRWTCPACLAIWEVQDCDGAKGWVRVADPVQGLLLLSGALLEMRWCTIFEISLNPLFEFAQRQAILRHLNDIRRSLLN